MDTILAIDEKISSDVAENVVALSAAYSRTPQKNPVNQPPAIPPSSENTPVEGYFSYKVDGQYIGVIPVSGLITETPAQSIMKGIQKARDNTSIASMVFAIDSPGGALSKIEQLAATIKELKKPTSAFATRATGGAYWIAAATDRITAAKTAQVGSLGVVRLARRKGDTGVKEIVSSASPMKRPDPDSEEGLSELQTEVDSLAEELYSSVASYRSTTEQKIKETKGRTLIGKQAYKNQLVDAIGFFWDALRTAAERGANGKPTASGTPSNRHVQGAGEPHGPSTTADTPSSHKVSDEEWDAAVQIAAGAGGANTSPHNEKDDGSQNADANLNSLSQSEREAAIGIAAGAANRRNGFVSEDQSEAQSNTKTPKHAQHLTFQEALAGVGTSEHNAVIQNMVNGAAQKNTPEAPDAESSEEEQAAKNIAEGGQESRKTTSPEEGSEEYKHAVEQVAKAGSRKLDQR